ncbi:MAG: septal ring lytic transglycosylase RlpA family protein [Ferruginibacter sp.]
MNTCLSTDKGFSKAVCFVTLFVASLILFVPVNAQSKGTASRVKAKSAKTNSKRIIYGQVSFYHNKFQGRKTSSGELFSQEKFTCACNMLPLGTWVKVTNLRNGRNVIVKVNDRLHPKMRRVADLSKIAARKLGYIGEGTTRVKLEVIGKIKPK